MKSERDDSVTRYMNQLFGRSSQHTKEPSGARPAVATSAQLPGPPANEVPQPDHPERRAQAAWLVSRGLLNDREARRLIRTSYLPFKFEERVLSEYAEAKAVGTIRGIDSEVIIPEPPEERLELPRRTFPGPYPPKISPGVARYLPIELHVAHIGKIFVGLRRTTLMLDERSYFAGVSRPASRWVTPVFAAAAGEIKLQGTAAVLFAQVDSFSHWMFDLMPKLEVLRRAGWTTDRIDHFVVNTFTWDFQKESFKRFGIPEGKVVPLSGSVVSADRFLIPSDVRWNFRTPVWASNFVRELFAPASGSLEEGTNNLRLYVSRGGSRIRRILNEDQIAPILEKHGFQTVLAERLSVAETAQLFARARYVFAAHGAGSTNVVFGRAGIRLMEAYSAHIDPEGWLLTHSMGGCHFLLAGHDKEGRFPWQEGAYEGLSQRQRNHAHYFVEPSALDRALELMTNS